MKSRTWIWLGAFLLTLAVLIGMIIAMVGGNNRPVQAVSAHETIILGQSHMHPGSSAALRVFVQDGIAGAPLADASVRILLKPQSGGTAKTLYEGKTDSSGTAAASFTIPKEVDASQTLIIETQSANGKDRVERPVQMERDNRILLTTDKPIYQPGQVIHIRALALSSFDYYPAAGETLEIIVADGKGNKVFRQQVTTSEYGAAWTDFQLASEVNSGNYKISARLGDTSSEKTVQVEPYSLPKFDLTVETEKAFYLPGEMVNGTLTARYFFGKPVSGGTVRMEGFTFDVQQNTTFTIDGETDENGVYTFSFTLPSYIAGSELDNGLGRFYLQASVIDQAQHTELRSISLPVSERSLIIDAVPEAGFLHPGLENILYVLSSYPDGSPAETELTISMSSGGAPFVVKTGEYGIAEVPLTPANVWELVSITARDMRGNTTQQDFSFEGEWLEESVLLRPEKPVYRVGDTMNLAIHTTAASGTVYVDIVRDGQTLSTRSVSVENQRANLAVDLTPDLFGTLELHAYKILSSGSITRDTRLVVVDQADNLNVLLTPDQSEYLPGSTAGLDIQVNGQDGQGVSAALGMAIVDEAVFALAQQDPGFARLYFLLEQEILVPRYDLHGYSVSTLVDGMPVDTPAALTRAVDQAASASLASAVRSSAPAYQSIFSLTANTREDAVQRAYQRQTRIANIAAVGSLSLLLLLPLASAALVIIPIAKRKEFWRSLILIAAVLFGLLVLLYLLPIDRYASWAQSPLDRLTIIPEWIGSLGDWAGWLTLLLIGGSLIAVLVSAIVYKDKILGGILALAVLLTAALVLFSASMYSTSGTPYPKIMAEIGIFAALIILPLTWLFTFAAQVFARRPVPAVSSVILAVLLMTTILPAMASSSMVRQSVFKADGDFMMDGAVMVEEAMAVPAAAAERQWGANAVSDKGTGSADTPSAEPRLRQYFPETMFWLPDAVTDASGHLSLEVPVADSITTWRITTLASSQDGRLGSSTAPLRVFQDFFIDLDLPASLTEGDELSVPVGIFNYLPEAQTIRLEIQTEPWFDLLEEPVKEVQVAPNEVSVAYFRIRAQQFGVQTLTVKAIGSKLSDAIQKPVRIYPDGKLITTTNSGRLETTAPVVVPVQLPAETIPGTQKLIVKIYPGVLSQVVEGLDSILAMPNGCFEQTSSTTYPDVLVLDYLRTSGQTAPEVEMKAEEYINLGYQRLTTFEVAGGGFSLFGDAPADRMLTAYGLQEFSDMSRVHDVDQALIDRAAQWLLSQQTADGSWENDQGLVHESSWSNLGDAHLPVTAYISWSLVQAGYASDERTQKGIDYVRERAANQTDPYVTALAANALVSADLASSGGKITDSTRAVLGTLADQAKRDDYGVYWASEIATFMGSEGKTASLETTAMAALAFLRADEYPDLANGALTTLIHAKDSQGTWYTTQTTVLSLKALIESIRAGQEKVNTHITVTLADNQTRELDITPENFDVVQMVTFEDFAPGSQNDLTILAQGEGSLMVQVNSQFYLPWEDVARYPELTGGAEQMNVTVAYDRSELAVNDTVQVTVTVELTEAGASAEAALIDLGLPPGFALISDDLDALVEAYNSRSAEDTATTFQRYDLTGRQILVYLTNLKAGEPFTFSYRLQARYPLAVRTPASSAYDYYNPEVTGERPPQLLVVKP